MSNVRMMWRCERWHCYRLKSELCVPKWSDGKFPFFSILQFFYIIILAVLFQIHLEKIYNVFDFVEEMVLKCSKLHLERSFMKRTYYPCEWTLYTYLNLYTEQNNFLLLSDELSGEMAFNWCCPLSTHTLSLFCL